MIRGYIVSEMGNYRISIREDCTFVDIDRRRESDYIMILADGAIPPSPPLVYDLSQPVDNST